MAEETETNKLKYGWTTGCCATAATKAAFEALITGTMPETVTITLPKGQQPIFEVVDGVIEPSSATAGIIKDAGDDPDVTHGAKIISTVALGGNGVSFEAGPGVGTVTMAGLPIPPGDPAINPVPRQMMRDIISELSLKHNVPDDVVIKISVPNGEAIAKKTWNGRLGIIGGISILGTTGIVVPYSCSAWIHSIHRGIDVARAANNSHIGAAVGNMSERLILSSHALKETDIIDMGDFVGGMLKYLKNNPVPNLTIAGGFAKMSKCAAGAMDMHSKRSKVDKQKLAQDLKSLGANEKDVERAKTANTALEILELSQELELTLGDKVAEQCLKVVHEKLQPTEMNIEILICDRSGNLVGKAVDPQFNKKTT